MKCEREFAIVMLNELLMPERERGNQPAIGVCAVRFHVFRIVMIGGALPLNTSNLLLYSHNWYHELLLAHAFSDFFKTAQIFHPHIIATPNPGTLS